LPDRAQNPIKSKIKQQGRPSISVKSNRTYLGWKAFEAPGVEPVFPEKDQAIDQEA
jgi:hypothetical protein